MCLSHHLRMVRTRSEAPAHVKKLLEFLPDSHTLPVSNMGPKATLQRDHEGTLHEMPTIGKLSKNTLVQLRPVLLVLQGIR